MNLRPALHELAVRHQLSADASARLIALGEHPREPFGIKRKFPMGLAILGAALCGMGIVFFIAANWGKLDRTTCFALLEIIIAAMCAGSLIRPAWRAPLSVIAFFAIGGLFAYFGQTYQSGADPWQLFAIWAALTLPLCLAVRHDALWTPWVLVTMTAVSLWVGVDASHFWNIHETQMMVYVKGWSAAMLLTFALGPMSTRFTGAGIWALRTSLTLTVMMITSAALVALFLNDGAQLYMFGLLMLCASGVPFIRQHPRDSFALSAVALGINVLLAGGLGRLLLLSDKGDFLGQLLVWGIGAALLLAATVTLLSRLIRQNSSEGASA